MKPNTEIRISPWWPFFLAVLCAPLSGGGWVGSILIILLYVIWYLTIERPRLENVRMLFDLYERSGRILREVYYYDPKQDKMVWKEPEEQSKELYRAADQFVKDYQRGKFRSLTHYK